MDVSVGEVLCESCILKMHEDHTIIVKGSVRDIDQTDFHRSEPSSRVRLMDEHSYQIN